MADQSRQAVTEEGLLAAFTAMGRPATYQEVTRRLGLEFNSSMRARLSRQIKPVLRQGLIVQVESPDDLRRLGVDPRDYPPHSKFWAVPDLLPDDVRQQALAQAASPAEPAKLTELGVLLEARLLASGMTKNAYLAERNIPVRTWWRLIMPGQERPRPETVIKYARLTGADVVKALKAAGHDPRLARGRTEARQEQFEG